MFDANNVSKCGWLCPFMFDANYVSKCDVAVVSFMETFQCKLQRQCRLQRHVALADCVGRARDRLATFKCLSWPSYMCLCMPQRLTALVARVGHAVVADWQRVQWWQARLSEGRARAAAEAAQRAREEQAQLRRCGEGLLWAPLLTCQRRGQCRIWEFWQDRERSAGYCAYLMHGGLFVFTICL